MSYNKTKIAVYEPALGYNKAAKIYKTFHAGLASYDKGLYQRFLPRNLADKRILDIGSGDARMFGYFADKHIASYIGFDCADQLLKRAPSRVQKVVGDIEGPWPFDDASIDIGLCFFVLVHISDITHFFEEAKRVLASDGNLIILHNRQRRSYIYELPHEATYKIQDYHWNPTDIQQAAEAAGRAVEVAVLEEKGTIIGHLFHMTH